MGKTEREAEEEETRKEHLLRDLIIELMKQGKQMMELDKPLMLADSNEQFVERIAELFQTDDVKRLDEMIESTKHRIETLTFEGMPNVAKKRR